MLLIPETIRRQHAEIARECQAGAITEAEAGVRLTEACPGFGGGYLLLGNGQSAAGDLAGAEFSYWKALERMPCDYSAYFSLSDVRRRQHGEGDALSRRLMLLGIWKLALSEEIPDEVAGFFRERMNKPDFDFKDPATYEALATALESEAEARTSRAARWPIYWPTSIP